MRFVFFISSFFFGEVLFSNVVELMFGIRAAVRMTTGGWLLGRE
jgi:hypothetical protein